MSKREDFTPSMDKSVQTVSVLSECDINAIVNFLHLALSKFVPFMSPTAIIAKTQTIKE